MIRRNRADPTCLGECRPRCACGTATVTTFERSRKAFEPLGERKMPSPPWRIKRDRKSTRLNSSHGYISYAVFCLKKKKKASIPIDQTSDYSTHNTASI